MSRRKAFQCSRCRHLQMNEDDKVSCHIADPRPGHREKGDRELCLEAFEQLQEDEVWCERFYWE